jgi:predicted nucleic acid-binding protein
VTVVKVVDASALGTLLFSEPAFESVAAQLRDSRLVAPTLLGYELASVCLKKIKANPDQRRNLLTTFEIWDQMGIELVDVDFTNVLAVAEQFGLTSYDGSYLSLARRLNVELVTLDRELARAAASLQPPR